MKFLLLVSFLRLWRRSDGTGAALIKVQVKEGDDAILPCSFSSESIRQVLFDWKKDKKNKMDKDQEVFMYDKGKVYDEGDSRQDEQFRGRVFHFPEHLDEGNASIIIRDTKLTDSGNYTCVFPLLHPIRRSNIVLVVGAAPKPSATILDGTTDWALLRCEIHGAFPKPDVRWQNRAGDIVPAEEPQVSERGGSYDIILQTTVTKTDLYRCVSIQEEISHRTHAEIFVLLNGAAPEPVIKILGETKEGVQLQCEVLGASPKPEVQWQNRAGDIVPAEEPQVSQRGGSYDIILQTTVTKTDLYRCVSTQEEINHQTEAETYVPVPDAGGTVPVWVIFVAVGVTFFLTLLVVGVVIYFVRKKKTPTEVPPEEMNFPKATMRRSHLLHAATDQVTSETGSELLQSCFSLDQQVFTFDSNTNEKLPSDDHTTLFI